MPITWFSPQKRIWTETYIPPATPRIEPKEDRCENCGHIFKKTDKKIEVTEGGYMSMPEGKTYCPRCYQKRQKETHGWRGSTIQHNEVTV